MAKPAVILVGADKGGVGKTTVARTLLDYFNAHQTPIRAFDTESPRGTLARFHPDVTEVVDVTQVPDQMKIFDTLGTTQAAVTGIDIRAGQIHGVETTRGRISTDAVICCAGAWAAEVGALAGVEIPVRGEPRWMWFSPEAGGLPDGMPMTIDFSTGLYAHREGPGVVFGGREATLEALAPAIERRLPVLAELPVQASWGGYYEVSPDHNAIVGELSGPSRFLVATGFSGHGFQQAPAVGEHLAELAAGVTPTLDLSPFSLERFASGAPRVERFVV